jgi:hypothetical protein
MGAYIRSRGSDSYRNVIRAAHFCSKHSIFTTDI